MEDDLWILLNIAVILVLILVNGFFVASEFALVKVRGERLVQLVESANTRARFAQYVVSRLNEYLSVCRISVTLVSLAIGWIGGTLIARLMVEPLMVYWGVADAWVMPLSLVLSFGIIAFLHIVFGVLLPKAVARNNSENIALWISGPLIVFYKATYPATWLITATANRLMSWFGVNPAGRQENGHTEEEIRSLMKESQRSGYINENELQLVENVFNFSERVVREIMVPRTMFICLYTEVSFAENLQIVQESRHTRYPVVENDKDHIVGWVHASDVYNTALNASSEDEPDIQSFIRPLKVVPESMGISQVLKTMQQERTHMVVIVDEFGGTAGLVTFEDIIEEIVGDIHDELREERDEVEIIDDQTSIDARMLIQDVNGLFHINIEDVDVDTIGGWVYGKLDEAPTIGQQVRFGDLTFTISEMDHLRIGRIEVSALPWTQEEAQLEETLHEVDYMKEKGSRAVS